MGSFGRSPNRKSKVEKMTDTIQTPFTGTRLNLTGPLKVELLANGRSARLIHPYRIGTADGRIIEVPEGFVTDFASVPRLFWRIVPPWGRYSPAAVVHDYLYQSAKVSRKEADDIFLELMARLGVPRWKRYTMYWAVRGFGGFAWDAHRKRQVAHA
jgi:hypothetical protein